MLTKIIERLQTGSISNVYAYGFFQNIGSPYVCLKPEIHPSGRGLRVICHYDLGNTVGENNANRIALESYIFNELSTLLKDYEYEDSNGNYVTVKDAEEYTDIIADNDDSTISMERLFYLPLRLH